MTFAEYIEANPQFGVVDQGNRSYIIGDHLKIVEPVIIDGCRFSLDGNSSITFGDYENRAAIENLIETVHDEPGIPLGTRLDISRSLDGELLTGDYVEIETETTNGVYRQIMNISWVAVDHLSFTGTVLIPVDKGTVISRLSLFPGITIRNSEFVGTKGQAVRLDRTDHAVIDNVTFSRAQLSCNGGLGTRLSHASFVNPTMTQSESGLRFNSTTEAQWDDVRYSGRSFGPQFNNCTGGGGSAIVSHGSSSRGFKLTACAWMKFSRVTVTGAGTHGLILSMGCRNNVFRDVTITDCGDYLYCGDNRGNEYNEVHGLTAYGARNTAVLFNKTDCNNLVTGARLGATGQNPVFDVGKNNRVDGGIGIKAADLDRWNMPRGSRWYVSDGVAGTNPVQAGGPGTWATKHEDGRWRADA